MGRGLRKSLPNKPLKLNCAFLFFWTNIISRLCFHSRPTEKMKEFLLRNIFLHFCWEASKVLFAISWVHLKLCKQKRMFSSTNNINFAFYRSLTFNFHLCRVIVAVATKRSLSLNIPQINFLFSRLYRCRNTNSLFPFSVWMNILKHASCHQFLIKKSFLDDALRPRWSRIFLSIISSSEFIISSLTVFVQCQRFLNEINK